ncbi:MAG TPA: nickel-dependent lactate racemase [Pyrinomonadaceae bacterium]|jgi:nickel-dependent lactate racemase|nr:nickel-dependent lactate racemase [Pyrinomonadaceae bacterium]
MTAISLKYGRSAIDLDLDATRFEILGREENAYTLSDVEIGERLDDPIDSRRLEDIVESGQTVLLVVPDATRQTGSGQIVNLVVRRLIANGTAPHEIRIIFATGIHRKVTDEEKAAILTPFIAQRIKTLDHDPRNLAALVNVGETSGGIPVELNRAIIEHDQVVIIGGVNFHYFAGFTGGRKLVCPGLASERTVSATHKLAFDCETLDRRDGVGTAKLDGNAVHEAFMECVIKTPTAFAITTITNEDGSIADLYCGDWITSHRAACDAYTGRNTIQVTELRDLVIASCGGYPHDTNMIQAHKALDAATGACKPGGTIVLLAACADGLGRSDFLGWFDSVDSGSLAAKLCEKYQVNGQTAWNLLLIAETYDVRIVTSLDDAVAAKMRLKKIEPADLGALVQNKNARGYVLPQGAKFHVVS